MNIDSDYSANGFQILVEKQHQGGVRTQPWSTRFLAKNTHKGVKSHVLEAYSVEICPHGSEPCD